MIRARSRSFAATALAAVAIAVAPSSVPGQPADESTAAPSPSPPPAALPGPLATYFTELGKSGLVDVATGSRDSLARELDVAEVLLAEGASVDAAVTLYAMIYSPRYDAFHDLVEYQNAEYDLGVALFAAGAYGEAADQFERVLARGPKAPYWAPAHRRMIDIALETRDHAGVLARLESVAPFAGANAPIPPGAAGERAYLRGRAAYDSGDRAKLGDAEKELATVSRKSRLYSSALYLRALIRTRQGQLGDAAAALCEIADQPDRDRFTFVVDDRYFTIKDLARLGLGRIAHETGEYDDAYYHYFQIPEDSDKLPDALFEAAWSMYQKRELATSRDLVDELLRDFPTSPQWPEASLLGGYVELADCKFDDARRDYTQLIARLAPIVTELDRLRKNPHLRRDLFEHALGRWRDERAGRQALAERRGGVAATTVTDEVLGLLRLDPEFVRLHDAVAGMDRAAGDAPATVRAWSGLARQVAATRVAAVSGERTIEEEDADAADLVASDLRRLGEEVTRARAELDRGRRAGAISAENARAEDTRLADLERRIAETAGRAEGLAHQAAEAVTARAAPGLLPLIRADVDRARRLERSADALRRRLAGAADHLAQRAIERLYLDTKRVLDKARLGTIDAVIGQKRALDITVTDLAAGRFPAELHGRLWEQGLIGDDEEYWPFEGEYWADEYEGWR